MKNDKIWKQKLELGMKGKKVVKVKTDKIGWYWF